MTLTIELTSQEEQHLHYARSKGINVEEIIRGFLLALPLADGEQDEESGNGKPSEEELEALFVGLAAGHETRPVLAPEATTRAGIYEDHD